MAWLITQVAASFVDCVKRRVVVELVSCELDMNGAAYKGDDKLSLKVNRGGWRGRSV